MVSFLTLNLLKTTIVAPPSNASKWQMGFNSALKGLSVEMSNEISLDILTLEEQVVLYNVGYQSFSAAPSGRAV